MDGNIMDSINMSKMRNMVKMKQARCCHSWEVIERGQYYRLEKGRNIEAVLMEKSRCRRCGLVNEGIVVPGF